MDFVIRLPMVATNFMEGIAFGDGVFVAVGERGGSLVSFNGTNWTLTPKPTWADPSTS